MSLQATARKYPPLISCLSPSPPLSNNTTLSFQWVPGHAGLPGNEKADLLAKARASLHTDAIPCPLPPVVAKVRYSQYHNWRRHISHSHLNFQVPEVSSEELLLSRPIRCELSRLRCHGHSLLLSSYLHRISQKENSACSACGHPLQDLNHLLLDCPASEPLRKSIFGSSLSILDLWSRPWGAPDCWVSGEFLRAPIPRKGSGSTTTTGSKTESAASNLSITNPTLYYLSPQSVLSLEAKQSLVHSQIDVAYCLSN